MSKVWKFYRNEHYPNDAVQVFSDEGNHVAWVDGKTPNEVITLFAAAPEMLELLRTLEGVTEEYAFSCHDGDTTFGSKRELASKAKVDKLFSLRDQVADLIAKAEGAR